MKASARFYCHLSLLLNAAILSCPLLLGGADPLQEKPALRRPVALGISGSWLLCGNRNSGSVSLVDLELLEVAAEYKTGQRLGDLEITGSGALVTDPATGRLLSLLIDDGKLETTGLLPLTGAPQDIALSQSGTSCSVSSPWKRQVTLVELEEIEGGQTRLVKTGEVRLPFSPGLQVFCRNDTLLVVADAFGGNLALVDPQKGKLLGTRVLEAHGIRGLVASRDGESLHLSHQRIESSVPTTRNRVFWGQVISNILRSISIDHLLQDGTARDGRPRAVAHWSLYPFGTPSKAAGDPGALAMGQRGTTLVAFGGVDRIGLRPKPNHVFEEIEVGDRPLAVVLGPQERYGYVANFFDDSISVVDTTEAEVVRTISLGPERKLSRAEEGEKLFYDAKLSLDGWYSCHSCHLDGHTHGQLNDNLGDDTYGTPKRVPTLLGTSNTGPWGWIGNRTTLWEQVEKSVETTMRGKKPEAPVVEALVAYLELFDKPAPASTEQDQAAVKRGSVIFRRLNCGKCHRPPAYTTVGSYDVGLSDEAGQGSYNPPSLRGLRHRARFLHDNRTRSISGALELHRPGSMKNLSGMDRSDLLSFLLSL